MAIEACRVHRGDSMQHWLPSPRSEPDHVEMALIRRMQGAAGCLHPRLRSPCHYHSQQKPQYLEMALIACNEQRCGSIGRSEASR